MADASRELLNELRATLGKMEVALGAINDSIVWTDPSGVIQWCNAAFDRLVGKPHIQVLGAQCVQVLPLEHDGRAVAPKDHPLNLALKSAAVHGIYECHILGRRVVLDISSARVQLGTENISVVLLHRDITVRQEMEDQLHQKMLELEGMNRMMVDREERMVQLKQEVNALLQELRRAPKYSV